MHLYSIMGNLIHPGSVLGHQNLPAVPLGASPVTLGPVPQLPILSHGLQMYHSDNNSLITITTCGLFTFVL